VSGGKVRCQEPFFPGFLLTKGKYTVTIMAWEGHIEPRLAGLFITFSIVPIAARQSLTRAVIMALFFGKIKGVGSLKSGTGRGFLGTVKAPWRSLARKPPRRYPAAKDWH